MPYFRDTLDEDYFFDTGSTPSEKLETAKWLSWCGWDKAARKILIEVACEVAFGDTEERLVHAKKEGKQSSRA